jgi:hypothetical protein
MVPQPLMSATNPSLKRMVPHTFLLSSKKDALVDGDVIGGPCVQDPPVGFRIRAGDLGSSWAMTRGSWMSMRRRGGGTAVWLELEDEAEVGLTGTTTAWP